MRLVVVVFLVCFVGFNTRSNRISVFYSRSVHLPSFQGSIDTKKPPLNLQDFYGPVESLVTAGIFYQ